MCTVIPKATLKQGHIPQLSVNHYSFPCYFHTVEYCEKYNRPGSMFEVLIDTYITNDLSVFPWQQTMKSPKPFVGHISSKQTSENRTKHNHYTSDMSTAAHVCACFGCTHQNNWEKKWIAPIMAVLQCSSGKTPGPGNHVDFLWPIKPSLTLF